MDTTTAQIIITLGRIESQLARIEAKLSNGGTSSRGGNVADDADLDGQYGDPKVRRDPKRWIENGGASFVGCTYSQCPSDYLEAVAGLLEWQAGKDEVNPDPEKSKWAPRARKDAARARGWAKRNVGKTPQPRAAAPAFDAAAFGDDDSLPF